MTWHAARDLPAPEPAPRVPYQWSVHEIVNAAFVKIPERSLRAALRLIAAVCTERGLDIAELLLDLETIEVPDQRYGRPAEDSRTAAALNAPYADLSDDMLEFVFKRVAASAVARGIDPAEVLGL